MQVLLDVSCLDHRQISGVGTYARCLSAALLAHPEISLTGSWRLSRRKKLEHIKSHWAGQLQPYIPVWSDWTSRRFDIFHGPDFKIPNVHGPRRVVTIHDMAVFEDGFTAPSFAQSGRDNITRVLEKQNPDAVIAVSEFTRAEILKRFPNLQDRVHAILHGADHLSKGGPHPLIGLPRPIPDRYFLFVGNLETRKNVVGLLRAFAKLKDKSVKLIVIGKPGFGFEAIEKTANGIPNVIFPGFVSNQDLVRYYQNAEAFVYPSFYEGFGFPILEAMNMDCPVITSSVSATGEVAGEAALLVHPDREEEIVAAMTRLLEDRPFRTQLIEKGRSRKNDFTWKKCGAETAALYQTLLD